MKNHIIHVLGTIAIALVRNVLCSIVGISYMDPIDFRPLPPYKPGEDPCRPLYWYPRHRPAYCDVRFPPPWSPPPLPPPTTPCPLPAPIPTQLAQPPAPLLPPIPIPVPVPLPLPIPPHYFPMPPAPMMPQYYPSAYPNQMMPGYPYPPLYPQYRQQIGMVPGIPGMVSRDGGINILPFSDAYSDLLEKHKQKMIRKRLNRVLADYEDFPNSRRRKRLRKYRKSLDS